MRILLPKGEQRKFIDRIISKVSVEEAAKLCNLSERTIRDWRREKFLMNQNLVYKLCKKTGLRLPSNFEIKDDYWYTKNGSSAGGIAVFKKYGRIGGDPDYRKKKWYEWWDREGKYKSKIIPKVKPIKQPKFSKKLAEFVGIVLGDGCIMGRQITITLNRIDDKEYGNFVLGLIKKMFNVYVGLCYRKNAPVINYNISRRELVRFCTEKLGLKQGNKIKQQIDIPEWIKQSKIYSIACVRGLIDTDGCIFNHNYKVKGKVYNYKKLSFTSYSKPLRYSVFKIMKDNGLNPRLSQGRDVRLDSIKDMKKYFQAIGSHNPKHLKKYLK